MVRCEDSCVPVSEKEGKRVRATGILFRGETWLKGRSRLGTFAELDRAGSVPGISTRVGKSDSKNSVCASRKDRVAQARSPGAAWDRNSRDRCNILSAHFRWPKSKRRATCRNKDEDQARRDNPARDIHRK